MIQKKSAIAPTQANRAYPGDVSVVCWSCPGLDGASASAWAACVRQAGAMIAAMSGIDAAFACCCHVPKPRPTANSDNTSRSEEHKSELQSLMRISYAVFCLEKKK